MAYISNYSSVTTVNGSILLAAYDPSVSDTRKMSVTELSNFIAGNISANISGYTTQYSSPSATGFTVNITDNKISIHLILTPTAGFAAGTIVLPLSSNVQDGQTLLVNCTQAVTTLTINGNGATAITGAPTTLAANDFFTLKYDKPNSVWYRVG